MLRVWGGGLPGGGGGRGESAGGWGESVGVSPSLPLVVSSSAAGTYLYVWRGKCIYACGG